MKVCTGCGVGKEPGEFYKRAASLDGLQYRCKACVSARSAEYNRRPEVREAQHEYNRRPEVREAQRLRGWLRCSAPPEVRAARAASSADYVLRNPEKLRAHRAVKRALRTGELTRPDACSVCGTECKPHGHHPDYTRPLDVMWLCALCHKEEHRKIDDSALHKKSLDYDRVAL